jgi:hypothetical protein
MSAKYSAFATATNTASATVAMWCLTGGTAGRLSLYHLILGSAATPGNQAGLFALRRTSARGTQSTSFTPKPLDPADVACNATFDLTWSADPTVTASSDLLEIPVNQQATFQWMVDPSYGIKVPATSGAGLAMMSVSTTSAAAHTHSVFFVE